MSLRIVFMGTSGFAVPTLDAIAPRHKVVAVYTRPPKPAGRRLDLRPSPVELAARRLDLPVFTPTTLRTPDAAGAMRAHGADVGVVVAYGLILPPPILEAFRHGAFNLHASLLPRWRGAAPINRAIMAGDPETGVMVMKMEEGLDTGPIAMEEHLPIEPDATFGELHNWLAEVGANLMVHALQEIERGPPTLKPQLEAEISYAHKIDKTKTRILWDRPWQEVHNHIRGLSPSPGAWFELAGARGLARIKVLRTTKGEGAGAPGTVLDDKLTVACGTGAVRILELQREGRPTMKAEEFLHGTPVAAGTRFA